MICPYCKIIVPDSAEFCQKCLLPINNHPAERLTKAENFKEMLACPKCGALHTSTAKHCRNDGTPFSKNREVEQNNNLLISKKNLPFRLIMFFILFVLFLSVPYLYFNKKNTKYLIDEHSNSKEKVILENRIEIPDFAMIEVDINRTLRKNGLSSIYVEVNTDLAATITGYFNKKEDRQRVLDIIRSYKEITKITDDTRRSAPKTEVNAQKLKYNISKELENKGLGGIDVEVDGSFYVTLKGAVKSADEKKMVFETTDLFKEIRKVKDIVFIVEN